MERSESIVKLATAMLAAQTKIEAAVKDSANPFFRSKYADVNSVMEACKGHLNDAGIVVTQMVESYTDGDFLATFFIHAESGEFMGSKMKLQGTADGMQAYGSAVTYARRYMLQSMAFVGAEDDDGNAATGKKVDPAPKFEKKVTRVEPQKVDDKVVVKPDHDSPIIGAVKAVETPAAIPTFSKKAVKAEVKKSAFED
jgi:hypothetical protein